MFCSSCGTEVPENAVFCHKCGERATDQVNPVESSAEPLPQNAPFSSQIASLFPKTVMSDSNLTLCMKQKRNFGQVDILHVQ